MTENATMNQNISELSIIELKSLCFDCLNLIQLYQNNLQMLQSELNRRQSSQIISPQNNDQNSSG